MKSSIHSIILFLSSLFNYSTAISIDSLNSMTTTNSLSESELLYDWRFTGTLFVLETSPLRLTISNFFQLNTWGHSPYVHPLWREDRSVVYNCCWPSPAQSFSGPSPAELMTTFYSQIRDSPNLQGQVPLFISPTMRVAQLYPQAPSPLRFSL
jgi:hypothetical protein